MIGIEMCQEAVEDAKVNAKLNGRSVFSLGKVHRGSLLWISLSFIFCAFRS